METETYLLLFNLIKLCYFILKWLYQEFVIFPSSMCFIALNYTLMHTKKYKHCTLESLLKFQHIKIVRDMKFIYRYKLIIDVYSYIIQMNNTIVRGMEMKVKILMREKKSLFPSTRSCIFQKKKPIRKSRE